jgi:hypothetical protein
MAGARAGVISTQSEAPIIGTEDIAQLAVCTADTNNIAGNGITVATANDWATYVSAAETNQGQTFTISGALKIHGFWVKHVGWASFLDNGTWYSLEAGGSINVRVCSVTGTSLSVLRSEAATVAPACTIRGSGDSGTGNWIYISLNTSLQLPAAGIYSFDLSTSGPYFEMDGVEADSYAGGSAFTTDASGDITTGTLHNGDRTFVIDVVAADSSFDIDNDIMTFNSLTRAAVNMSGRSELHLMRAAAPLRGCSINLTGDDSYLFFDFVKPSTATGYLNQVKVDGENAVLDGNIRVVQYAAGSVIIPQGASYKPLEVFSEENFSGSSTLLGQFTEYGADQLGNFSGNIRSFILKRGYTATFSNDAGGVGYSKNYVAQDCDLEIAVMPPKFNGNIIYVRVYPWRWVSKKGIVGYVGTPSAAADALEVQWNYEYGTIYQNPLDRDHVPLRATRWWPGIWANGSGNLLGYNEPDHADQSNITVTDAIWSWSDLLWLGMRQGSPAPADDGRSWLYDFMGRAKAHDLRVDYAVMHYYWCASGNNPATAASNMYNYIKSVHDATGLPVWITEWNNGANWTNCGDPTDAQQAACLKAMMEMLDSTPFVERYSLYNWVEDCRSVWLNESLTEAGKVYRDQISPIGYKQLPVDHTKSSRGLYEFDSDFRDASGNGNNALVYGAPNLSSGYHGNALELDGANDYLKLSNSIGSDENFSFAAWVNWNGESMWQRIFDFGNDTTQYLFLTPRSGANTLRFAIKNGGSEQYIETSPLPVGEWTHVAVTLRDDIAKLFVNGEMLAKNTAATINPSDFQPSANYIGKSQFADPLFSGKIDDIVITDRALTNDEVLELFNNNRKAKFAGVPLDIAGVSFGAEQTNDIYSDNGAIDNAAVDSFDRDRNTYWANDGNLATAWITFDLGSVREIDRIKLKLYSSRARTYPLTIDIDGTVVFSGNTATTTGYWEPEFEPVSGRNVTVTMTAANSDGGGWLGIYETEIIEPLNEPPYFTALISAVVAAEGSLFSLNLAGGAVDPEGGSVSFRKISGPSWVSVTEDGAVSGVPSDSDVGINELSVGASDADDNITAAAMQITVANTYSGILGIDDLAGLLESWLATDCLDFPPCGGADLTADEAVDIEDFAVQARNWLGDESLQLYLPLSAARGSATKDASIYNRTALLYNDPQISADGLQLDGSDDYVEIAGYKGVTGTSSRTYSARIKTSSTNTELISWGSDSGGGKWLILIDSTGRLRTAVNGGFIAGSTNLADGRWHHLAVVLENDGSPDISEAKLYVNGQLDATSAFDTQAVDTGACQNVQIGLCELQQAFRYFDGIIDEVRIFDRALSADEIGQLAQ